jgi:hypothetical protein
MKNNSPRCLTICQVFQRILKANEYFTAQNKLVLDAYFIFSEQSEIMFHECLGFMKDER